MNLFNSVHSGINKNNIKYGIIISNPNTYTINTVTDATGDIYNVYSFTSGTNSMKINLGMSTTFYYLCCAGGGVGGADSGGGGGGGGYLDGTLNLMSETVNINVGAGGYWTDTPNPAVQSDITNPTDSLITGSTFSEIRSIKGGAGGSYAFVGSSGGSGGGSRPRYPYDAYAGTSGQGNAGAKNGGGGAGQQGGESPGTLRGGFGGDGKLCNMNGIKLVYPTTKFCAGGGGGSGRIGAAGGTTGGGNSFGGNATSWGSGGGGGGRGNGIVGGNGYSGIIVFAYKIS